MTEALLKAGAAVGLPEALLLRDDERVRAMIEEDKSMVFGPMPNDGTPLHFCCSKDAATLLLNAGVDPHQTDKYGKTALDAASGRKPPIPAVVAVLSQFIGKQHTNAGHLAAMGDLHGLIDWHRYHANGLLQRFTVQWQPQPLLHIAAERAHDEIVSWLLQQGPNPNERTDDGMTALHAAAWNGHLSTVQMLVAAGADVQARDCPYNNTPKGFAMNNWESVARPGCKEVAEWLRQFSA